MEAKVELRQFAAFGDARGQLIAIEALSAQMPFEVRRMYYIFDTRPGVDRGMHSHRNLKQLLVCVSGACTVECEMPDGTKHEYRLDWPDKGLLVEGLVWRKMKDFCKDSVLVVLASEHYDERDYIRDYGAFRTLANEYMAKDGRINGVI